MNPILTVTSPASSYDLTTLAAVKTALGITTGDDDTRISTWITQASKRIETYCNRVFPVEAVSEVFRLDRGLDKLVLGRAPVTAITTVTEDGEAVVAADYELDAGPGFLMRLDDDEPTDWPAVKITIVYSAGFATIPADIAWACTELVKQLRSFATRDPMMKREEIPDVRTVDYWVGQVGESSASLPPEIAAVLDPYRMVTI